MSRLEQIPDEVSFVDEDDNPLPEFGIWELTPEHKTFILLRAIKWRQSITVTMERIARNAIREYIDCRRIDLSGVRYEDPK